MNTPSILRRAAFLLLISLWMTSASSAIAQETTAAIQGTVTDPSGAVVPNATVTATGDKLIRPVETKTDSHGFYRLNALPPGTYTLTVSGGGMVAKATNLSVVAGDLPTMNFRLTASGTETVIDVNASVAMVDVTQSKVETTITNQILQEIPKGRSFQSVIPFAPGARQEPLQSVAPATTSAAGVLNQSRANGFQIDGASDGENVYMMEGVNITGIVGGGVGYNVPMEFVQDVQVKSSSFEAENGGALGGVINVIGQRGGSNWHGQVFTYYRSSAMNANDQCSYNYTTACGLGKTGSADSIARLDAAPWYYTAKQDHYRIVNPGFSIGGPILTEKVWMFAGYAPEFFRLRRDVNFIGTTNPGPRSFYQNQDQHYGYARLEYSPISKVRLFASWYDMYTRLTGNSLPNPDSKLGQTNSTATNDPTIYRADSGQVMPASIYFFGGDYTVTSRLLLSVRYGYLYNNASDRGKPTGIRYYMDSGSVDTKTGTIPTSALDGSTVPQAYWQKSGASNIASNTQQQFNILKRKGLNVDVSYLQSGWAGTHNFKAGYSWNSTFNNLNSGSKTALVYADYGIDYTVQTSTTACDAIISANIAKYGPSAANHCRGNYGYFYVYDYSTGGIARGNNSSIYGQDSWSLGRTGLTLNVGIRFDKEYLPPYSPGASDISFGFTQKVAPRIGGAYDVLHNGKLKVFASYGQFYDIIKYSLPRGSFGGEYWHNCVYAMDDPNIQTVVPGNNSDGHACPTSGGAIGLGTNFRFIENLDLRRNVINTQDPGVDPNVSPMKQHEVVAGSEWAITPTLTFSGRYSRKRLDNTIEDIGVTDNLGFYIGNPGPGYGDLLHRTLYAAGYTSPLCSACPAQPKAIRQYDGFELRLMKFAGSRYFFSAFYNYSQLRGNYPGLTSTFNTDGSGGRQSPNNNRSFDQPQMQFNAHGKPFSGRLPTDRPNTFGAFGSYRVKWFAGDSQLGLMQQIYQGSPVSTAWPVVSASAVQFVEDQGSWLPITRGTNGVITPGALQRNRRTPAYMQTDASVTHYIHVSKSHENRRLGAEFNIYNLLGQHAVLGYNQTPLTAATYPSVPISTNPTGIDFQSLLTGWDYIGVSNANNSLGNKTVSSSYGLPNLFQGGRQIRMKFAYVF